MLQRLGDTIQQDGLPHMARPRGLTLKVFSTCGLWCGLALSLTGLHACSAPLLCLLIRRSGCLAAADCAVMLTS
jgi:hypothetical protein